MHLQIIVTMRSPGRWVGASCVYIYSLGTDISKGVTVPSLLMKPSVHAAATACSGTSFTNICPGRKGSSLPEYMLDTILCTAHESHMILETFAAAAVTETERVPVLRQVSVAQRSSAHPS